MELNDALLIALGRITFRFALLEGWMHHYIELLIRPEDHTTHIRTIGMIVTVGMDFRRLCDTLHSLLREKLNRPLTNTDERTLLQISDVIKRVRAAAEMRNKIIHSSWAPAVDLIDKPDDESIEYSVSKVDALRVRATHDSKKGLVIQIERYTPEDLESVASELKDTLDHLNTVMKSLNEEYFLYSED